MIRRLALVATSAALVACSGSGAPSTAPGVERETVFRDARATVVLETTTARGADPDTVAPYRVLVITPGAALEQPVLIGSAQLASVRARVFATRLDSGVLAIAHGDRVCTYDGTPFCTQLRPSGLTTAHFAPVLAWRAADPAAPADARARAAITLARVDRERGLPLLEDLTLTLGDEGAIHLEARAVLAHLSGDELELATLAALAPDATGPELLSLARACASELEPALRDQLPRLGDAPRHDLDSILADCERTRSRAERRAEALSDLAARAAEIREAAPQGPEPAPTAPPE